MRESFVFHSEYIEDLPEEYKTDYLIYTYNYGIHEKIPQLEGLEQALWIKIQKRIDADRTQYEISTLKKKINAINVRINNNKASENDKKNIEAYKSKLNKLNENIPFNLKLNELNEVNPTNTPYVYVFVNVSVSVFEYVSVFVSVSDIDAFAQDTHTAQFPIKLFNLFKDADLPCSKKNLVNFIKTDFKNAVEYLANSDIYKDFTVQDITIAVENFVQIVSASDTYEGYKHKINLYSLVQKKWFYELINGNIDFFKIHDNTQKTHDNVIKYHDLCPVCKTRTADWMNEKGKYFCSNCNQYFDEVIYE